MYAFFNSFHGLGDFGCTYAACARANTLKPLPILPEAQQLASKSEQAVRRQPKFGALNIEIIYQLLGDMASLSHFLGCLKWVLKYTWEWKVKLQILQCQKLRSQGPDSSCKVQRATE